MGKARRKDKDVSSTSQEEPKIYLESTVLECTIPESRLRDLVQLHQGLDYNEWLASHTIAFFDHINLLYGTVSEFCTMSGCPDMTGPGNRQYLWFDEKGKKCKVAAPQYIDYVMTFTQKTVNDESVFPTKFEKEFPSSFESIVKKIHRLLLHVIAHLYHAHFKEILLLSLHAHLNSLFSHFTLFNNEFNLVEEKDSDVLHDLAIALKLCPSSAEPAESATQQVAVDANDNKESLHVPDDKEHLNRLSATAVTSSSPSIPSSLTALHSRAGSTGSNSSTCGLDSAIFCGSSIAASSPVKFQ